MQHITAFLASQANQTVYYPALYEAKKLDSEGNFVRSFSWHIERNRRDEFERAVIADGLKPMRFGGFFITGGRA